MQYFCPECWSELPADLARCPDCGADLTRERDYEDKLIAALRHPVAESRRVACSVLGLRPRSSRAREALLNALHDPDAFIREAAVTALGNIGSPQDIPVLEALLSCDTVRVRHAARKALAALSGGVGR